MSENGSQTSPEPNVPPQPQQPGYTGAPSTSPMPSSQAPQTYETTPPPFQPYQAAPSQTPTQPSAPYYQSPPAASSGKAIGALVCGIFSILLSWVPLFGIILGIIAIVLASKAVKEAGKDGKSTGGKICGIVGIILSVLTFIAALLLGSFLLMFSEFDTSSSALEQYGSSNLSTEVEPSSEAETQLEAAAKIELDKIVNKDTALVQKIATDLDTAFQSSAGYSLTDLGVEPTLFAEYVLANFEYTVNGASDGKDGTGLVYVDVTLRDSYTFAKTFEADLQAFIESVDSSTLDEATAKAKLGEVFKGAMEKSTETTTSYLAIIVTDQNGTWAVDDEAWTSDLDSLFGLF